MCRAVLRLGGESVMQALGIMIAGFREATAIERLAVAARKTWRGRRGMMIVLRLRSRPRSGPMLVSEAAIAFLMRADQERI